MEKIKVNKQNLLDVLVENREKHLEDYNLALEGYKITAKKELSKKAKELKNLDLSDEKAVKDFNLYLHASKPDCHEDDFDTVIGMLKLSVDAEIYITPQEYKWYYLNEWQWRDNWVTSNSFYMTTGITGPAGSKGTTGKSGMAGSVGTKTSKKK